MKIKIKKNDTVRVIAGNDKGKEGRVIEIFPDKMRLSVEGVNVRKKHMKPTQMRPEGAILEKEMPIHYSNVLLLDGTKNPTRLGSSVIEEAGEKKRVRIAKTTGEQV